MKNNLIVLGINHRAASVDQRALMAWTLEQQKNYLETIALLPGVRECVLMVTCNRCECMAIVDEDAALKRWWLEVSQSLYDKTYQLRGVVAIDHLLTVACGLDSQIMGEQQILGQIKRSYKLACSLGYCRVYLSFLLDQVIYHARYVRQKSNLSQQSMSLSRLCLREIETFSQSHRVEHIVCVGSGRVIQSILRLLTDKLAVKFSLVCRNPRKDLALADVFNLELCSFCGLRSTIMSADIVISATSSPTEIIGLGDLSGLDHPILFLDFATPRDVAPEVLRHPSCTLRHMEDLKVDCADLPSAHLSALEQARGIAKEHSRRLYASWLMRSSNATVVVFREKVECCRQQVLTWVDQALMRGALPDLVVKEAALRLNGLLRELIKLYNIPGYVNAPVCVDCGVQKDEDVFVARARIERYLYQLSQRQAHEPTSWLKAQLLEQVSVC